MSPQQLTRLVASLGSAAEVVDAIDDVELQRLRGWDLSDWRYEPVLWGVCFTQRGAGAYGITVRLGADGRLAQESLGGDAVAASIH